MTMVVDILRYYQLRKYWFVDNLVVVDIFLVLPFFHKLNWPIHKLYQFVLWFHQNHKLISQLDAKTYLKKKKKKNKKKKKKIGKKSIYKIVLVIPSDHKLRTKSGLYDRSSL